MTYLRKSLAKLDRSPFFMKRYTTEKLGHNLDPKSKLKNANIAMRKTKLSLCRDFMCCFPLVGGMTSLTSAVMVCENCANLWRGKLRAYLTTSIPSIQMNIIGLIYFPNLNKIWLARYSSHTNAPST